MYSKKEMTIKIVEKMWETVGMIGGCCMNESWDCGKSWIQRMIQDISCQRMGYIHCRKWLYLLVWRFIIAIPVFIVNGKKDFMSTPIKL